MPRTKRAPGSTSHFLSIRLADHEVLALDALCDQSGQSPSALVRAWIASGILPASITMGSAARPTARASAVPMTSAVAALPAQGRAPGAPRIRSPGRETSAIDRPFDGPSVRPLADSAKARALVEPLWQYIDREAPIGPLDTISLPLVVSVWHERGHEVQDVWGALDLIRQEGKIELHPDTSPQLLDDWERDYVKPGPRGSVQSTIVLRD